MVDQPLLHSDKNTMISRQILDILTSEKFAKWYAGEFTDWLEAVDNAPLESDILLDIERIFKCRHIEPTLGCFCNEE